MPLPSFEYIELSVGEERKDVDLQVEKIVWDGVVKGTIVTADGAPVPQARVDIRRKEMWGGYEVASYQAFVSTNKQGEFTAAVQPWKKLEIQVDARGFLHQSQTFNPFDQPFRITLQPAGSIQGTVKDAKTKQPITNALVSVETETPTALEKTLPPTTYGVPNYTRTGADGYFIIDSLNPGFACLKVEAVNYVRQTSSKKYEIQSGSVIKDLEFFLKKGNEISGILMDSQSHPIADAEISLLSRMKNRGEYGYGYPLELIDPIRSDKQGQFLISGIQSQGKEGLIIRHPQYAAQLVPITPETIPDNPIPITLTPGGALEGMVVDREGKPAKGADIYLSDIPRNLFGFDTKTDEKGKYRFEHLPPLKYLVKKHFITHPDIDDTEQLQVVIEEGKVAQANFGAGPGAVIRGTVYVDGKPFPNTYVVIRDNDSGERFTKDSVLVSQSNQDGVYQLNAVPPGDWYIGFILETNQPRPQQMRIDPIYHERFEAYHKISIQSDQKEYTVDLHAKALKLILTVRDEKTGQGIPDAEILIADIQKRYIPSRFFVCGKTDSLGKADIFPQESGHHFLVIRKTGYAARLVQIPINPLKSDNQNEAITEHEVRLHSPESTLEAHLLYEGKPFVMKPQYVGIVWGEYEIPVLLQPIANQPGKYIISGCPDEIPESILTINCGREYFMTPFKRGKAAVFLGELVPYAIFFIRLKDPDNQELTGPVDVDYIDYPQFSKFLSPSRIRGGNVNILAALGKHAVRFRIPGYKPLEFIPEESTSVYPSSFVLDLQKE